MCPNDIIKCQCIGKAWVCLEKDDSKLYCYDNSQALAREKGDNFLNTEKKLNPKRKSMNISHAFNAHPQKRDILYGSLNESNYNVLYLLQMSLPDVDFIPRGGLRCMLLRIRISNAVHIYSVESTKQCHLSC